MPKVGLEPTQGKDKNTNGRHKAGYLQRWAENNARLFPRQKLRYQTISNERT